MTHTLLAATDFSAPARHALERATAAAQREDLQRQFDEALAQAAATREAFEHQLSDTAAATVRGIRRRGATPSSPAAGHRSP